jgi:hypothetical protein
MQQHAAALPIQLLMLRDAWGMICAFDVHRLWGKQQQHSKSWTNVSKALCIYMSHICIMAVTTALDHLTNVFSD